MRGPFRISQQPGLVRKPEQLGEMLDGAGALLPAHHHEMVLVPIQPGHEDHAGFVEARWRLEDMAAERDGGCQDGVKGREVIAGERGQGAAHRRGDGVENAQQRIGMAMRVAGNEFGVVEIIAGIHPHAFWQAAAHGDFLLVVQKGDFHPIHLVGMGVDDGQRRLHRRHVVVVAPIAVQRWVEHFAQPMDNDGGPHAAQDAGIDALVIGGRFRRLGQRARRHEDDAAAHGLHRLALLLIGADDVIDGHVRAGGQMVGAGAGGDDRAWVVLRGVEAEADEVLGCCPIQPHAALGGVHGFGDAQAERP